MAVPASQFAARRVTRTRQQTYAAPPALVFPLHDFIEEEAWAVGWEPVPVHPDDASGKREGAVFVVRRDGIEEIWVLTVWDPRAGRVGYVHLTAGRDVTHLDIRVSGPEEGPATVVVTYTWTALSPAGNAFVELQTEEAFRRWMDEWEEEMVYYLRTRTKLERP